MMTQMSNEYISLGPASVSNLETFFIFQADEASNQMAAFTAKDPGDKKAYLPNGVNSFWTLL